MAKFLGGVGHGLQGAAQVLAENGKAYHRDQQHNEGHKYKHLGNSRQNLANALHRLRYQHQAAHGSVRHGTDLRHQVAVFFVDAG